jgi:hypothetical protein
MVKPALLVGGAALYFGTAVGSYIYLRSTKAPPLERPGEQDAPGCSTHVFDGLAADYDKKIDLDETLMGIKLLRRWLLLKAEASRLQGIHAPAATRRPSAPRGMALLGRAGPGRRPQLPPLRPPIRPGRRRATCSRCLRAPAATCGTTAWAAGACGRSHLQTHPSRCCGSRLRSFESWRRAAAPRPGRWSCAWRTCRRWSARRGPRPPPPPAPRQRRPRLQAAAAAAAAAGDLARTSPESARLRRGRLTWWWTRLGSARTPTRSERSRQALEARQRSSAGFSGGG